MYEPSLLQSAEGIWWYYWNLDEYYSISSSFLQFKSSVVGVLYILSIIGWGGRAMYYRYDTMNGHSTRYFLPRYSGLHIYIVLNKYECLVPDTNVSPISKT